MEYFTDFEGYPNLSIEHSTEYLTGDKTWQDFTTNVKRIAIMFYGQWRTGDYCLNHIEEFYNLPEDCDVEVDVFVSLKDYVSYSNQPSWMEKHGDKKYFKIDTDHVLHELSERFNVVKSRIVSVDNEIEIFHDYPFYKAHYALLDAIMLKQEYEAENNIVYDLVIAQRFDIVTTPVNAYKMLVHEMVAGNVDFSRDLYTGRTEVLLTHPMGGKMRNSLFAGLDTIQDLWMVGTNSVFDIMAAELFTILPRSSDQVINQQSNKYIAPWRHRLDAHNGFRMACDVNKLPVRYFPAVDQKNNCLYWHDSSPYFKFENGVYNNGEVCVEHITSMVIRESELTEANAPDMFTPELLHKHFEIWMKR